MAYTMIEVSPRDTRLLAQADALLAREGLTRDRNLDYICAACDEELRAVATGSCFGNTLRCFAVDRGHQGEGLLNLVLTHLTEVQYARGNFRLFLCTKASTAKFFEALGFYEVARVEGTLVFMENRRDGFSGYLRELGKKRREGRSAAIVMNANPFTLGHQYLVETAAKACDTLHLFLVSEEASLVPFRVRKRLVQEGTAHLPNVVLHDGGPYIISAATFPSYFLEDGDAVIEGHARLDLAVFVKIAEALGISIRFAGQEPTSHVTGIYNRLMSAGLPKAGIACEIIPRKEMGGEPVSASVVRRLLQEGRLEEIRPLTPPSTYAYFASPEAAPVLERIRKAGNVAHY